MYVYFDIFSVFSDFGEILKNLRYDHEIAYLSMNYRSEDVVNISGPATNQNPRSQGGGGTTPYHLPGQKTGYSPTVNIKTQ